MHTSQSVENYLKVIGKLSNYGEKPVLTNAIASEMNTKAASVTEMLKKLATKKLIKHKPYYGVSLTALGMQQAIQIIRKHRLWELFLVQTLQFKWHEVHAIAEQLEHVQSEELISRIDRFLNHPEFDPHGDPIPDAKGKIPKRNVTELAQLAVNKEAELNAVTNHTDSFLHYIESLGLKIGSTIKIISRNEFDNSLKVKTRQHAEVFISHEVARHLLMKIKI